MSGYSSAQVRAVRRIFAASHGRYDLLNRLLSFRRDVGWRSCAARAMAFGATNRMLDVATGTADLAISAALRHPSIAITGIDFSRPMIEIGRRKVRSRGLEDRIALAVGDAMALPFPAAFFDVSAIAFGLRNIPDRLGALREMARVTAPGGQVMVLEMAFAPTPAFGPLYGLYLREVLPRIASLIARDPRAYRYLTDSILRFPAPPVLAGMMEEAGLKQVRCHRLTFGAAWLHIGVVPRTSGGSPRPARAGNNLKEGA